MHRAAPPCPLGASEWRGARCSLVKTGRLQPARLSLPHNVCPVRPGTSQFRPTEPGERKEERPRAWGQMSEFLFPRVLLIMLVRKRKRAQTFAFTLFQISTRSLFPLPVSEKISHLENHGWCRRGPSIWSHLVSSGYMFTPINPVTLDKWLCPLCLSFPTKLDNAWEVFTNGPHTCRCICYYLCKLSSTKTNCLSVWGNNNTYFTELLLGLSWIMRVRCLMC